LKKKTGIIAGIIIVCIALFIWLNYNSLVSKEENVKKMWSEVQSTYQRRLDLVPNLVNVVKGVSGFEQETLVKITEARSAALSGLTSDATDAENVQAQNRLQDTLAAAANRIIIQIERYPELKGTEAYAGLQAQLEGTERRIKVARKDFNEAINSYNRKVRSFPSNLIAGLFGFGKKEGFAADEGADQAVERKF